MPGKKKIKRSKFRLWIRTILIALLIALFIRGFVVESFTVSSSKMESSLFEGDYIFVSKFRFGARTPITLLSLPFSTSVYSGAIELPYWRLPGFGKLKPGDILVFNNPEENDPPVDKKQQYMKRLVALPGDTVFIENKMLYVNNVSQDSSENYQYKYRVVTDGTHFSDSLLGDMGIYEGGIIADMGIYDFYTTPALADSLLTLNFVSNVRIMKDYPRENTTEIFPKNAFFGWNKDYFGPVAVPAKGVTVSLDIRNIALYKRIIEIYEGNKLEVSTKEIKINGETATEYTFKMDYFFVMDDNRDNAKDSRYWGFVPEDHIIGTASFVWISFDKSERSDRTIRWERCFRKL